MNDDGGRVQRGEAAAWIAATAQRRRLRTVARNAGVPPGEAEDAVQEGLLKAYQRRDSINPKANVSAWLARIVHNAAVDMVRKRATCQQPLSYQAIVAGLADGEEAHIPALIDHGMTPEHGAIVKEELAAVVRQLTPQELALFVLKAQGYSDREVAALLGLPAGTLKSRIHQARARLRDAQATHGERTPA